MRREDEPEAVKKFMSLGLTEREAKSLTAAALRGEPASMQELDMLLHFHQEMPDEGDCTIDELRETLAELLKFGLISEETLRV